MEYVMNIVFFTSGFFIGVILAVIVQFVINRNIKSSQENIYRLMQAEFENTATKIFNSSTQGITEKNAQCLDGFLKQFKEKIEDFEKRNNDNLKVENEKLQNFDNNIKQFLEAGLKISQNADAFAKIMKADNRKGGSWGEMVLYRVFESSGLRKGEEYEIQKAVIDGRPDATVFLPENKKVFVDAKTSLESWDNYMNAQSDDERKEYLKDFKQSLKKHIDGLSGKYTKENAINYVMMFIPIESCYSLVFCDDCEIWDYAWKRNVMPVSPSTLLAALKIVNSLLDVDRQNKNTDEIIRICKGMRDKFAALLDDLKKVNSSLNSAFTKLDGKGNLISQIERLEKLGIKTNKEIKMIDFVEEVQE